MKKSHLRDYATNAFRLYAAEGKPTHDELRERIFRRILAEITPPEVSGGGVSKPTEQEIMAAEKRLDDYAAYLQDIAAVERTVDILQRDVRGQFILECLDEVYFKSPNIPLRRGDIHDRVVAAMHKLYIGSENTVYSALRKAVRIFARERGLNGSCVENNIAANE